ncbi:MAG: biotin/lipoyl-binding protein, partial [Candidatus Peribacteraceae bacterium]|nr:biotin/lipoyl-binding protein [Candidatus Peribacteraceae bacterium]
MPKKSSAPAEVVNIVSKKTMLDRLLIALFWIGRFIRRRWLILLIIGICSLPVIGIAAFLMMPEEPEIIVEDAKKGILIQAVEAVGTVISEKDLELKFPVTGVVSGVNVNEGDVVEAGTILAALRSKNVSQAEVNFAAASVQSAQANLQELEEGTRPEEIAVAQAEVENRKASLRLAETSLSTAEANLEKTEEKLELVIKEAETNLAGDINSAGSVISQNATKAQSAINAIDDIYNKTVVRNAVEFYSLTETEKVRIKQTEAKEMVTDLLLQLNTQNFDETLIRLTNARVALLSASNSAVFAYNILSSTHPSAYFTDTIKETHKASVTTQRNNIETALNAVTAELESFRNASDGYRTSITTQEIAVTSASGLRDKALTDISTYETLLKTQEAQLALKKAGARETDIKAAKAKVNQAYADLQRANAKLEDTILRAPIDGSITKVDVQVGEFSGDSRSITMLGNSPFRIELFASEIDITKVKLS